MVIEFEIKPKQKMLSVEINDGCQNVSGIMHAIDK